jgi:hypothetical protein
MQPSEGQQARGGGCSGRLGRKPQRYRHLKEKGLSLVTENVVLMRMKELKHRPCLQNIRHVWRIQPARSCHQTCCDTGSAGFH